MRTFNVFFMIFMLCRGCFADYYHTPRYYCTSKNQQHIVDIGQLEGIWFVKEKILHTDERHYVANLTTCPIIYIRTDESQSIPYNPQYKKYDSNYGSDYPYATASEHQYNQQREDYDRRTTYDYPRRKASQAYYGNAMRNLRIIWDESSFSTEYHLRYNVSEPGFWKSFGSDDGKIPQDQKHFAGIIQVLKAVGNHLVLNFCHSIPEKNHHFTVILSREHYLENSDIHNVHSMLLRNALTINAIEKSCNKAPTGGLSVTLFLFVLVFNIRSFVKILLILL